MNWLTRDVLNFKPLKRRATWGLLLAGLAFSPTALLADVGAGETIASGLSNPRGIAFAPNGALYVVEQGSGGSGPCIPSPSQPPGVVRCFGLTGAVTKILPDGGTRRLVTGLPSMVLPNGTTEGGPAKLSFQGMAAYVIMGLAGDPAAVRDALGGEGDLFGTLLRVTPSGQYQVVADIAAHESANNPAGGTIDSNPYGVLALAGKRVVADAGGNALIEVRADGGTKTLAVPPPLAGGRQPVPTSVTQGPDGALYAGLLTGFPFFRGTASVLRIATDGGLSTYAAGFTTIVDIAFDAGGALYVLETASGQVPPFPPPNPGLGAGRLKRQCPGGAPTVLVDGLTFPGGVAIGSDSAAYITNFGTSPTAGEVLRLPLTPCP